MSHGHSVRSADKIQIQNLKEKVDKLEGVVGDLILALKESNPEMIIKHTNYVEKIKR